MLLIDKIVGQDALLDTRRPVAQQRTTYTTDHAEHNHDTAVR